MIPNPFQCLYTTTRGACACARLLLRWNVAFDVRPQTTPWIRESATTHRERTSWQCGSRAKSVSRAAREGFFPSWRHLLVPTNPFSTKCQEPDFTQMLLNTTCELAQSGSFVQLHRGTWTTCLVPWEAYKFKKSQYLRRQKRDHLQEKENDDSPKRPSFAPYTRRQLQMGDVQNLAILLTKLNIPIPSFTPLSKCIFRVQLSQSLCCKIFTQSLEKRDTNGCKNHPRPGSRNPRWRKEFSNCAIRTCRSCGRPLFWGCPWRSWWGSRPART